MNEREAKGIENATGKQARSVPDRLTKKGGGHQSRGEMIAVMLAG